METLHIGNRGKPHGPFKVECDVGVNSVDVFYPAVRALLETGRVEAVFLQMTGIRLARELER